MTGRGPSRRTFANATLAGALALGVVAVTDAVGGVPTSLAVDAATEECTDAPVVAAPPVPQLSSFTGQTPRRLVDTRDGTGGVDGPVGAECYLRIDVDAAGIPAEAGALALSITALGDEAGFQQVFPCDDGRGEVSNVNNRVGAFPTPNLVVGLPDDDRELCVWTLFEADLLVDVSGWWTEEGPERFRAVDPVRVDDSREGSGLAPGGDTPRPIDLSGFVPAGTTSIVANLTVTEPTEDGFMVIFPCGTDAPTASNLNFRANESRAVSVVVGLDGDRKVCTSSNTEHHVILDLAGYYGPAPQFGPAAEFRPEPGRRLADSRDGTGGWSTPLAALETRRLDVASLLPDGQQATGLVLNVTVTEPVAPGFLRVTGCNSTDTEVSSVNFSQANQVASNLVVVDLADSPAICVFSLVRADVIVDLFGVLRAESDEMLAERIGVSDVTWPRYRPSGENYVTECSDTVTLDLDLLTGVRARVNGLSIQSGELDISLASPDELIRLELRRGSTVQRTHLRCVPDDFRRLDVFATDDRDPAWYLTLVPGNGVAPTRAVILDEYGGPIWWADSPGPGVAVFERSAAGNLIAVPIRGSRFSIDPDRGNTEHRLDGSLVAEFVSVDTPTPPTGAATDNPTDHHDHVELPGGGAALISYPTYDGVDLSALGTGFDGDELITDNLIQEIDANGDLVWEWRMSDHFAFSPGPGGGTNLTLTADEIPYPVRWTDTPSAVIGYPDDGEGDVDVFHINSLDRLPDGDYLVSARHLDAIFRVDRATGDVDWIVRSNEVTAPNASGAPVLTLVGDPLGGPRRPHDALLTGDLLTFFDNRTDTGQAARAVTYRIDPAGGTATFVDAIEEPNGQTSLGLGAFRQGADGSALVTWGAPIQPMFQEFDATGAVDFQVVLPGGGNTYRAVRYDRSAFNAITLRATAGTTLRIPS